jgi:hypothetical protein
MVARTYLPIALKEYMHTVKITNNVDNESGEV